MSLLQNVLSLIPKKKPANEPINIPPQEPVIGPSSTNASHPDNVIFIYSHGFTNGVYRIDPDQDSFERFLEYCGHLDRIKDERALKEKAIAQLELKINAAETSNSEDTDTTVEKGILAENVSVSITELEQRRQKRDQKITTLMTQAKETVPEYAWVPAFLFFGAGVTFIAADISITKQITSWGFNMTGWQSWIFAIGLASTAFLIKPAIDRLLEKPFQAAGLKLKTLYKCVLLGITVVGLIMLYCLGKFRSDSEIARNSLNGITTQMNTMDPNSLKYINLQKQYDTIQKSLDENSMGQTGLVISGMLFAIGSAICLSIAFGSLKQLINRYWILPYRILRIKNEVKVQDKQFTALRSELTTIDIEYEKAVKRLSANAISALKGELKQLQGEYLILLADFYRAQYEKECALYLDGKSKGEKYQIEGNLVYKISGNDHSSHFLKEQETKDNSQLPVSARPYTRRPFVKMRKIIADNFNKNQNSQTYDGTEFEIVS